MRPTSLCKPRSFSRRFAPFAPTSMATALVTVGVLGVGLTAALTGCASSPRKDDGGLAANSNVPAAPSVDRSKCSDKGKQVITSDTNQDKQPDVWKFFVTGA